MIIRSPNSVQLALAVGHYMAAVSEELSSRDIAVNLIRSIGPYQDGDYRFIDTEGDISFSVGNLGQPNQVLHWSGISGWCTELEAVEPFRERTRWMCAGLLPHPIDVATYCEAVMSNRLGVGREQTPVYRNAGENFPELLELLSNYIPEGGFPISPSDRLIEARQEMYLRRITELTRPSKLDDRLISVALRKHDLQVTVELLEYAKISSSQVELANLIQEVIDLFRE